MKLNLVTVVGYNTITTSQMLKHYENMVDKIYVGVVTDKEHLFVLDELEELNIPVHKVVIQDKFNWYGVTPLYNEIKASRPNDWWIVADDDELQVYPEPIEDIINTCEKNGYDFVTGGFLDRIGIDGTLPEVTRDTDLHKTFPLAGFFRYPMSGACPNKVTLMKGYQKVTDGQHYAQVGNSTSWGRKHPKRMPVEECFTQVHHFKWDSSVLERLLWTASMTDYYRSTKEFKKMHDAIIGSGGKIDISNLKYLVEDMKEFSYIDYNDYPHWSTLMNKIVTI